MGRFSEWLVSSLDRVQGRLHFFVAVIALLGTLLLGSSGVAWQLSAEQHKLATAYTQTLRALRAANEVKLATLDTLRGERGYLLTDEAGYLEPYLRGRQDLERSLDRLERDTRPDPASEAAVRQLRAAADSYLAQLGGVVDVTRMGRRDEALRMVKRNHARDAIGRINRAVDVIIDQERSHLAAIFEHVADVTAQLVRFIYIISFAGLCLLILSALTAIALRRSFEREHRYREELRHRAETDELTGIPNRRQLLANLNHAVAAARKNRTPLSFALLDIDNFKQVNDTHGHAVGDEVIRRVVKAALATIRGNDSMGRLGGEEFGILLPMTSEMNALAVCERLRDRIHNHVVALEDGQEVSVTISSGIACLTDEDDAASLVQRADEALYGAKRSGRDRVKLAA